MVFSEVLFSAWYRRVLVPLLLGVVQWVAIPYVAVTFPLGLPVVVLRLPGPPLSHYGCNGWY